MHHFVQSFTQYREAPNTDTPLASACSTGKDIPPQIGANPVVLATRAVATSLPGLPSRCRRRLILKLTEPIHLQSDVGKLWYWHYWTCHVHPSKPLVHIWLEFDENTVIIVTYAAVSTFDLRVLAQISDHGLRDSTKRLIADESSMKMLRREEEGVCAYV